jgi:hypothetical protein
MATENRNITYLNKDFSQFRSSLIDYAKTYFPTVYNDFSPSSPGMMFLEMAAYVGDVMSFYLDNQIQENFIQYVRQQNNIYALAYMLGYKPKVTSVSITDIDVYQKLPTIGDQPDYNYTLYIPENFSVNSPLQSGAKFLIQDPIDFSFSSSYDPTEITLYDTNYYLLKKTRKAISAEIKSTSFTFGVPQSFQTVDINDSNIIGILDITDSDGNKWYEVPYLAQEMIYDTIKNTNINNPNFSSDSGDTPYLLQLKKVQRRFVTRIIDPTTLRIQFGSGTNTANNDEEVTPNPDNVGIGLPYKQSKLTTAFSPTNFLFTDTYGIAPYQTTLTVRYLIGGGIQSNTGANTLTTITDRSTIKFQNVGLDTTLANAVFNSVAVTNPLASNGGGAGDTADDIRLKAMNTFTTQQRTVTLDDYMVRAMSLPSNYGNIAKVYVESEKLSNLLPGETPSVLNLYALTFNFNKHLQPASNAVKQNLSTYLSQYRMMNDSIKIKDAFIINIGVDFEINVLPNYNSNLVIANCISKLKEYFNIDNWQINEPILLRDLYIMLDNVDGVQTIKTINIINKYGSLLGYSNYSYDIPGATVNNVIYPSLDPMIFELKYPDSDIKGRVVTF